jgi:DNA-directed RNA polymerase subunit K/omega
VELIPEEKYVSVKQKKIMSAWLTEYEYVALIQARSSQLVTTDPLVDPKDYDYDFIKIAKAEIDAKLPSLVVGRKRNDGTFEYWNLSDLFFPA